jgi:hypothetical protein
MQRGTSRSSRHFSRYNPPRIWPHLYIYMVRASYLYVDISRPSEMLPRIIKLAKYFRATTVITQAPRSFCSPYPRRLDARSQPVRQFAMKRGEREREREREREKARASAREIRARICLARADADECIYQPSRVALLRGSRSCNEQKR